MCQTIPVAKIIWSTPLNLRGVRIWTYKYVIWGNGKRRKGGGVSGLSKGMMRALSEYKGTRRKRESYRSY